MVLKNGRMADNHKRMALLSSKSIMPAEESPSSWCCTPQRPSTSKQRAGRWEGPKKGERKGKGIGNESNEVSQDKRLKFTSCDVELSPGARKSRDSEGQSGMMGIFIAKTCFAPLRTGCLPQKLPSLPSLIWESCKFEKPTKYS